MRNSSSGLIRENLTRRKNPSLASEVSISWPLFAGTNSGRFAAISEYGSIVNSAASSFKTAEPIDGYDDHAPKQDGSKSFRPNTTVLGDLPKLPSGLRRKELAMVDV